MKTYAAIDLKSFYASVECAARGLDPLTTNLVVADTTRTEKTICLAVSPSLKALGVPGRPRLFEVIEKVKEINADRLARAVREHRAVIRCGPDGKKTPGFASSSFQARDLEKDPSLELSYIAAPPQMARYMKVSSEVYQIYLKYIAPEDIHVYSIDEVFLDLTPYLGIYRMSARELVMAMIREVLFATGITATAGIADNLYLAKIAMDIVAKHIPPDENGVRIAVLDELSYRRLLWTHRPLTDFWRIGHGTARRLEQNGLYTMGDVARCSLGRPEDFYNEDLLYRIFGIGAELLIDHAWGWEPCTIADIRAYRPENTSLSSGQVLSCPYPFDKARLVAREMTDSLAFDLTAHGSLTDQLTLTVSYDTQNLRDPAIRQRYRGPVSCDHYGRPVPKHAHGSCSLPSPTGSSRLLSEEMMRLFDRIVDPGLLVRRISISAGRLVPARPEGGAVFQGSPDERPGSRGPFENAPDELPKMSSGLSAAPYDGPENENAAFSDLPGGTSDAPRQLDLFTDFGLAETDAGAKAREYARRQEAREQKMQEALLGIRQKYGKNAVLKGMNLEEGATAMARNQQIGGHRA